MKLEKHGMFNWKGKDVILGPKVNILEKHAGKTRVV